MLLISPFPQQTRCHGAFDNINNIFDLVCDVAIERTDLEDSGRVQLNCIVTGNATSLTWTRDGELVPETSSQPATLLVEIPSKYAKGRTTFECQVECSEHLSQRAILKLESFGQHETEMTIAIIVNVVMAVGFIGMAMLQICFYYRRYRRRVRAAQECADELGLGGLAIALNARPMQQSRSGIGGGFLST